MRRVVVPALLTLLLAGACGSSSGGGAAATTAASTGSSAGLPSVTGAVGAKPAIAKPTGKQPTALATRVVTPGTGATVAAGEYLVVNYLGMTWAGKEFDNSFDRGQPFGFVVGAGGVIKGWDQGLVGQQVGSRVLLGIPADLAYGAKGQGSDIPPDAALLFVVDVLGAFPTKAGGAAVAVADPALPTVTGDGATLAVTVPGGAAPTALVVKALIEGSGPAVVTGQQIVVQYLGALWDGGKVFDSSWQRGGKPVTFAIGAGKVIKGWDESLVGVKAGSRVLLVIPSDKAYGDAGRPPTIPAKAALVFVVDVLGSY